MSKLIAYLSILGTIMVALNIFGLTDNTGSSILIELMKNPEELFSSNFFTSIENVLALALAGGIVVGLIVSQRLEFAVTIAFVSVLILIAWDILDIFLKFRVYSPELALLLISPLLILYLVSVMEWWKGTG